jgi:hypothetical protein
VRDIDRGCRVAIEAGSPNVPDDADDRDGFVGDLVNLDSAADDIHVLNVGPQALGQLLTHEHMGCRVIDLEKSAGRQRNTHGCEVSWRHGAIERLGAIEPRLLVGFQKDQQGVAFGLRRQRQDTDCACGRDAR